MSRQSRGPGVTRPGLMNEVGVVSYACPGLPAPPQHPLQIGRPDQAGVTSRASTIAAISPPSGRRATSGPAGSPGRGQVLRWNRHRGPARVSARSPGSTWASCLRHRQRPPHRPAPRAPPLRGRHPTGLAHPGQGDQHPTARPASGVPGQEAVRHTVETKGGVMPLHMAAPSAGSPNVPGVRACSQSRAAGDAGLRRQRRFRRRRAAIRRLPR